MSDLPKVKNYEVKIRIKNNDLPKARISNKTINCNLPKVRKSLKQIAESYQQWQVRFLTFTVSKREKDRERINSLHRSLFIPNFSYPNCCTLNCLA